MHNDHILPQNIALRYFCVECNVYLEYPSCPKCNVKELPPLGVNLSDGVGVTGKVGK